MDKVIEIEINLIQSMMKNVNLHLLKFIPLVTVTYVFSLEIYKNVNIANFAYYEKTRLQNVQLCFTSITVPHLKTVYRPL